MSKFSIVNLDGKVQWCSLLDAVYWIDIAIIMGQNVFENIRGTMGYTAIYSRSHDGPIGRGILCSRIMKCCEHSPLELGQPRKIKDVPVFPNLR
jgi:hypothetical protein